MEPDDAFGPASTTPPPYSSEAAAPTAAAAAAAAPAAAPACCCQCGCCCEGCLSCCCCCLSCAPCVIGASVMYCLNQLVILSRCLFICRAALHSVRPTSCSFSPDAARTSWTCGSSSSSSSKDSQPLHDAPVQLPPAHTDGTLHSSCCQCRIVIWLAEC